MQPTYVSMAILFCLFLGALQNMYSLKPLANFKGVEIVVACSCGLLRLTYFLPRVFLDMLSSASSALGQTIVFMTALFYLLSAEESCLAVVGDTWLKPSG